MSVCPKNPPEVAALRLREVTSAQCALAGLLGSGVTATIEIAGEAADFTLTLPGPSSPPLCPDPVVLSGRSGRIVIGNGVVVLRVLTGIDIDVADGLADGKRSWLLQQALALLPGSFSGVLDHPFEIGEATIDNLQVLAWADAYMYAGTAGVRFGVGAEIPAWRRLLAHPAITPFASSPAECPMRLACVVGRCVLPASAVRALAVGDAVLDTSGLFSADGEGIVRVGRRAMRGRIDQVGNRTIFKFMRWEAKMSSEPESGGMAPADEGELGADRMFDDLSDVPVSVSFDIGHVASTIQAVAALVPGSVLVIDTQAMPPDVVVRVNGARIGSGTLVEVNGRLAVQITSVFGSV